MPVVVPARAYVLPSKGALPRPQHTAARRSWAPKAAPAHVATPQLVTEEAARPAEADALRFGFPKGSLQNSTHELFRKAGAHTATARVVPPAEPLPCAEQARCSACHRCGQPVGPRARGRRPGCGIARRAGSQRGRAATLAACAARAGFKVDISERGYFPRVDDEELQFVLFRSQEIRWRPPRRAACVGVLSCSTLTCPLSGPLHALAGAREACFLGMPEGPGAGWLQHAVHHCSASVPAQPVCGGRRPGRGHLRARLDRGERGRRGGGAPLPSAKERAELARSMVTRWARVRCPGACPWPPAPSAAHARCNAASAAVSAPERAGVAVLRSPRPPPQVLTLQHAARPARRCASWRTVRPPTGPRAGCWPCRRTAPSSARPTWQARSRAPTRLRPMRGRPLGTACRVAPARPPARQQRRST